jgi:hypothetical protein
MGGSGTAPGTDLDMARVMDLDTEAAAPDTPAGRGMPPVAATDRQRQDTPLADRHTVLRKRGTVMPPGMQAEKRPT